jgi:hypothetical protein
MKFISTILIFCLCATGLYAAPNEPDYQLIVNNRVLAKVNGNVITVVDVMKKMDLYLNQHYPQLSSSKAARFQFYLTNWKSSLEQLVQTQLMLADAESKEIKVGDGDVRETMQERFGPNVMATLDRLGLSYEEARRMIRDEMVVQRIEWFRVNSKVLQKIGAQAIKQAYQEYLDKNPAVKHWKYQLFSIRSPEAEEGATWAAKASELLKAGPAELEKAAEQLRQQAPATIVFTVSPVYERDDKLLADVHRGVLQTLQPGGFSDPIAQFNQTDNVHIYRIFLLQDEVMVLPPSFDKMADKLRTSLIEKALVEETEIYMAYLKKRFGEYESFLSDPQDKSGAIAQLEPFEVR